MNDPDPRYPIGRRPDLDPGDAQVRQDAIDAISSLPAALRADVAAMRDAQLDTPYREGGWTVRQIVHHLADSHIHSYVRFRLALTEDEPIVQDYDVAAWAELPDARSGSIEPSLNLLAALHERWVALLASMRDEEFDRAFVHPGSGRRITLGTNLLIYAWHGEHHRAHIAAAGQRQPG